MQDDCGAPTRCAPDGTFKDCAPTKPTAAAQDDALAVDIIPDGTKESNVGHSTFTAHVLTATFGVVFLAFVPSIWYFFKHGTWTMNPIYPYTNPFQKLVSAHAFSGLALLGLFAAQVYSGATGIKWFHRISGYYMVIPFTMVTLGCAVAMEIATAMCCQDLGVNYQQFMLTLFIVTTFSLGIRAAMLKRIPEHKDWMLWTTLSTCHVGLARVGMYLVQPLYKCDSFKSDWPFVISTVLTNLVAFICLRWAGRFNWDHKCNLAIWMFQNMNLVFLTWGVVHFECFDD